MEHHADFAIAVAQGMTVETEYARPDGGTVTGRVLALGWWVGEPGGAEEPPGTLHLSPTRPCRARSGARRAA